LRRRDDAALDRRAGLASAMLAGTASRIEFLE
jgi:hypothetical protein